MTIASGLMHFAAGISLFGATAVAIQAPAASSVQDWTVLGLLSAVVLGIGARLVGATEKQTQKLAEMTTKLEVLGGEIRGLKDELRRGLPTRE